MLLVVGLGFMYADDGDSYYSPPSYHDSGAGYDEPGPSRPSPSAS